MEENTKSSEQVVGEVYQYAANLMVNQNKNSVEVKDALVAKGLSESAAFTIIGNIEDQIVKAKKDRAKKDMLYGALWCIGGTVATAAHIGFIFWGAILFGAIQFFKGLANSFNAD